jgi:hypothetical protein
MDLCRWIQWGRAVAGVAAVVVAAGLTGCATPATPKTAEEIVQARAQQKWDAMVKGDIESAYKLMSPGSRAVLSLEAYRGSLRVGFWKAAKAQRVTCASAESCTAEVEIEYEFRGARMKTVLPETWVKQDADWWFVQQ